MMKRTRILWLLCLGLLLAGLSACGPKDTEDANPPAQAEQNEPAGEQTPSGETPATPEPPSSDPVPEDPNAITFFDCGTLDLPNGAEPTGRENFEEFLNVTGVGKSAAIQITQYTVEGDPIVSALSYDGTAYTLKVDNTADAFAGDGAGVTESTWARLAITEETGEDGTLYQAFRLTNLDEGAVTGETPDGDDVYTLFQEPLVD